MRVITLIYILTFFMGCRAQKSATTMNSTVVSAQKNDNKLTKKEIEEGWQLLFDGKTMNNWRSYQNKEVNVWSVENGVLVNVIPAGKAEKRADIVTTEQYENFEFSFDWRIAPKSNSGVIYHVSEAYPASYLSGPEYQLLDDLGYGGSEKQKTGADYDMYAPSANVTKPIGEFNSSKIVVNGTRREHWLNGVKVVEFEAGSDDWTERKEKSKWKGVKTYAASNKGHICLQDHGGGVWFKNIKIRKL